MMVIDLLPQIIGATLLSIALIISALKKKTTISIAIIVMAIGFLILTQAA